MDTNNWGPTGQGGEVAMDAGDWRAQLQSDSRRRIVDRMSRFVVYPPIHEPEILYCNCGLRALLRTSWGDENPGRRFYGCPKYKTGRKCKFFKWVDPEMSERAIFVINELIKDKERLSAELENCKSYHRVAFSNAMDSHLEANNLADEVVHLSKEVELLKMEKWNEDLQMLNLKKKSSLLLLVILSWFFFVVFEFVLK